MLKRSFAEFHAQKSVTESHALLAKMLSQPAKSIEYVRHHFIC